MSRKLGLTIDSVAGVEIVTADGQLVAADEHTRQDLFWAVRGGGGNFGVVTRLRYRLHPIGTVLGGALFLPARHEVIRGVIDLADAAPEGVDDDLADHPDPAALDRAAGGARSAGGADHPRFGAGSLKRVNGSSTASARWRRRSRTCFIYDPTRRCTSSSPKLPSRSPTSPTASRPTSRTTRRSGRSCSS